MALKISNAYFQRISCIYTIYLCKDRTWTLTHNLPAVRVLHEVYRVLMEVCDAIFKDPSANIAHYCLHYSSEPTSCGLNRPLCLFKTLFVLIHQSGYIFVARSRVYFFSLSHSIDCQYLFGSVIGSQSVGIVGLRHYPISSGLSRTVIQWCYSTRKLLANL